jgi:hypothetical protein
MGELVLVGLEGSDVEVEVVVNFYLSQGKTHK